MSTEEANSLALILTDLVEAEFQKRHVVLSEKELDKIFEKIQNITHDYSEGYKHQMD